MAYHLLQTLEKLGIPAYNFPNGLECDDLFRLPGLNTRPDLVERLKKCMKSEGIYICYWNIKSTYWCLHLIHQRNRHNHHLHTPMVYKCLYHYSQTRQIYTWSLKVKKYFIEYIDKINKVLKMLDIIRNWQIIYQA